ncbi:efflux RND transporter periplasmic adaptor subunit [Hyphomicrobium sp. 2TAF46]|uniref:efflux RND transporter periplasmic adaptor subunit n=1 Tax=Hyphomicrobium sp. 2TAF46 TaxID=3233019 RepID=UPI003F8F9DF7
MVRRFSRLWLLFTPLAVLALAGCKAETPVEASADPASPALVSVMAVKPETVTLIDELPGRVVAYRTAEIRPQVGGIIERRLFEQGSELKAGQALFEINPEPFKADVASAAAALQRAQAALVRAQTKFDRARQLVPTNAISQASYDDTVANLADAKAGVAEAQATLDRRHLDLGFATVRAPIAGRIGPELISEGALVSASGASALAIIQQIDQVYVDVRQPAAQIDIIRAATQSGQLEAVSNIPVVIVGASGNPYPVSGRALFSDITVDPGTGNVTVRVQVANPDRLLLPGMYVRARLPRGVRDNALLVPQEAVIRDQAGMPRLVIIGKARMPERRAIELGEFVDGRYIVRSGLKAGESVVVQGQERVQDGVPAETVPFGLSAAQAQN